MPWFHHQSAEEKQQKEAAQAAERQQQEAARAAADQEARIQAQSIQALQAGGIPVRAQERIAQIRAGGVPLFSSDLSVDEFLLSRQAGYEPLGLVAGSSMYHIGWSLWTYTGEMEVQTRAMYEAASLAIDRLRQEAQGMGALGVVGTRLEIKRPSWGERMVEVIAMGTAIRARGAGPTQAPFISGFSAQEYWSLLQAGSRPLGLVFGNTTFYIYTNWRAARQNMSWYNNEVTHYSQSLHKAQSLAFGRMHAAAFSMQAAGVVGAHIEHHLTAIPREDSQGDEEPYSDYVLEYLCWGTAVRSAPNAVQPARPGMVIDLEEAQRTARFTPGAGPVAVPIEAPQRMASIEE